MNNHFIFTIFIALLFGLIITSISLIFCSNQSNQSNDKNIIKKNNENNENNSNNDLCNICFKLFLINLIFFISASPFIFQMIYNELLKNSEN